MSEATARIRVAETLRRSPVIGVVRTETHRRASEIARGWIDAGLEMIEITFSVPRATDLVEQLLGERPDDATYCIGMGTATTSQRAMAAVTAGAEFVISPNVSEEVATAVLDGERYLILGALTPTEIFNADDLGADLVKVYPLPTVGGAQYLKTVRGPLGGISMLAAGGFGPDEIPDYRNAGAIAFGIGDPLIGTDSKQTREIVQQALRLARGEDPA